MKKSAALFRSVAISATLLASATAAAAPAVVPEAPQIAAKGYVLMDYHSGKILAGKKEYDQIPPASLTKMMTSYVIGQEVNRGNISMDDTVVISKNAWAKNFPGSSKMFIEVGSEVKVSDLNRGIIIQSGNDACVAMAEHVAGSEDSFVDLMNAWARTLGMDSTHFANVHGLDNPDLYTTPYDMALLAQGLIRDVPDEFAIYKEKSFTYNGITQYNRNSLLWDKSLNVDGLKTGHTNNAGYSLVSTATEGQMRLIAVVMGTSNPNARKAESKKLLNYGFRFFETVSPHKANETFVTEKVWMGDKDEVSLGVSEDTFVTLPRGLTKDLTASFVLEKELKAPIQKGDVVGKLYYRVGEEDIAEYPLLALDDIKEGSMFSRLIDYIMLLFKGWLS
ncbi:D-alanyl-D-alanine carboxypeptidase [Photobacterium gaetbulicola]|uniref:serine-type D-Ala-D-Ala carboxypeptidase n=2 Tax=Photobacterium gaetbulicola TaxID=1295392 RepID=A0A0C5WKK0_9GAMM|nr:serine hydrolase [Photobacterium gaetbulicola]AJR07703.1 D-alanyl-D-alanine carboxypeptidase (penicillin-binding protein 5) [Photobacterium gaetbulicola Gung47]KHT63654.1 D-alanyl-D-alanine carboxypeptidase [Photobacterium gaetbulicola]PSU02407.1 D-alanyl-D-alanine carboxypeptidase [Photobacterium gaetbulicola]